MLPFLDPRILPQEVLFIGHPWNTRFALCLNIDLTSSYRLSLAQIEIGDPKQLMTTSSLHYCELMTRTDAFRHVAQVVNRSGTSFTGVYGCFPQ